jgi:hypothetical protein
MEKFISKPSIDMMPGIRVDKTTEFEYENDNVKQELKDLKFKSITTIKGENFKSEYHTEIDLQEGDILIFEDEGRGYIKPVESFVSVDEAIKELENIK